MTSPFPYMSKFVERPYGVVHYIDEGAGAPIVIMTPAPLSIILERRLIDALRNNFRVVAFDMPGFGLSGAAADFPHTLEAYSDAAVAFCERLDLQGTTLFLNDTAGCIGLRAAVKMPERVSRLVIVGTVGFPLVGNFFPVRVMLKNIVGSSAFRWANRNYNLLPYLVSAVAPLLNRPTPADRAYHLHQFPTKQSRERIVDVLEQIGRDQLFLERQEEGVRQQLKDKPVLLLYGSLDPMYLFGAPKKFQSLFSKTESLTIPLESHFPHIASGKKVAEHVTRWMLPETAVAAGA
jgi:haloalkane dehalogenase